MTPSRPIALLAAALTLAAAVGGCGSEETPEPPDLRRLAREATVTQAEIKKAPENSAERTVLEWWRLTQFRSQNAVELFTPEAMQTLEAADYDRLSFRYLSPWIATLRPEIEEIKESEGETDVFVTLSGPRYLSPTKATLSLQQVDGRWLLSDTTFMLEQARLLEEQEKATAKAQG